MITLGFKKMSSNKKKNLLLLILVFCCCLLSVGYFTIINAAIVEGNIKLEPAVWDVNFKSIKTLNVIGKAQNYQKPRLTPKLIEFYAEFHEVGDTIEYEIDIKNSGNLDARLDSIHFLPGYSKYLDYKWEGVYEGMKLKAGKQMTTKLKLKYDKQNDSMAKEIKHVKLILNWEQDD